MAPTRRGIGSNATDSQRNGGMPNPDNVSSKYTSGLHLFRKEFHQKNKGKARQGSVKDKYRNGEINEAWRSLPEEEKAMYNQMANIERKQFQESHGPRKKFQAAFQTKCSPKYFQVGLANLSDSQREEVKSMGFESLLRMTCGTLARELCYELVYMFDPWNRCLNIRGTSISITAEDMGSILGLPASGHEVPIRGLKIEDLKHSFGKLEFKEYPKLFLNGEVNGLYFKRAFLLFAFGVLLCPTTKTLPSTKHLHAVVDAENAIQYNWGKFFLDWLVEGVKSQKPSLGTDTRSKTKAPKWFGGCLYFLMIFYFQRFHVNPRGLVSDRNAIEYWTNENVYYQIKCEREAKNNHNEEATMTQHEMSLLEAGVSQETATEASSKFLSDPNVVLNTAARSYQINDEIIREVPIVESLWDYSFLTSTTQDEFPYFYQETTIEVPTPSPIGTNLLCDNPAQDGEWSFDDLAREGNRFLENPTEEGRQINQEIPFEASTSQSNVNPNLPSNTRGGGTPQESIPTISPLGMELFMENLAQVDDSFFENLSIDGDWLSNNPVQEGQVHNLETQSPVDPNLPSIATGGAPQIVQESRTEIVTQSPLDIDRFLDVLAKEDGWHLSNRNPAR